MEKNRIDELVSKWIGDNATTKEIFQDIKDLDFEELMNATKENPQLMWVLMFGFCPAKEPPELEDQ